MAAFLLTLCSLGAVSYWHGAAWSKTAAGWAPDGINTCPSAQQTQAPLATTPTGLPVPSPAGCPMPWVVLTRAGVGAQPPW